MVLHTLSPLSSVMKYYLSITIFQMEQLRKVSILLKVTELINEEQKFKPTSPRFQSQFLCLRSEP